MLINKHQIIGFGLVLAFSTVPQSVFSQDFLSGLGIELGGGYNQIFAKLLLPVPPGLPTETNREGFSELPTVRIKYDINFLPVVNLMPFLGYNRFGGRYSRADGYKDEFRFDVLEIGSFASYSIGPIDLAPGFKANHHFKMTATYSGPPENTQNMSWLFRRWSYDLGLRGSFNLGNWNLATESWFGISSFQTPSLDGKVRWRQNHFRVLVGYTL